MAEQSKALEAQNTIPVPDDLASFSEQEIKEIFQEARNTAEEVRRRVRMNQAFACPPPSSKS
jgi:hypothetical protein